MYGGRHTVAMLIGDGVSPEMMEHIKCIYYALGAPVDFDEVSLDINSSDEAVREAILAVRRNGVALKGSIKTVPGELPFFLNFQWLLLLISALCINLGFLDENPQHRSDIVPIGILRNSILFRYQIY